jgi:hypothetical protein
MKTTDVVYRDDLYPRIAKDPATVQKYAEDLSVLPPIEVNQHGELIDGWHRWTAHKKQEVVEIAAIVTVTTSDAHLLEIAIERNASHGLQLSQADKQSMARRIYHVTPDGERVEKKKHLAKILSVSSATVNSWLSRIDKDAKEERNERIYAKWLACYTQEEIAEGEGMVQPAITQILSKFPDLEILIKSTQTLATYAEEGWTAPIYNVWKMQTKSAGVNHFGNSEVSFVDNLLYLYTKPFDIVVDPFAGGGSTVDLCKRRSRRYFVSDRKPIVERTEDIRQHDLIADSGVVVLPSVPRWKDVGLVYLDPPYWRQAAGQYSADPTDLANVDKDTFDRYLSGIVKAFADKLKASARTEPAYIALIIQPTQWKSDGKKYTDHVGDMLRSVKLPVDMRYSVPYESQQYTPQMVNWAKENKRCLVLTREIVVWEVS